MKRPSIFDSIIVDEYSATPKYLQLTNSILKGISNGKIKKNDRLPSINELSFELDISRDTAEKGYKHLKNIGVLGSVPGKGYFIKSTELDKPLKIFLLFNKLSSHKKIIYDAIVEGLGSNVLIDFYIYNNDFSLFKKLILNQKVEEYSYFVVIPHFLEGGDNIHEVINTIPKDKLLLLDKQIKGLSGEYAAVYENFEIDIFNALEKAIEPLSKYHTIKIIFPENSYYPIEILHGFNRFCQDYAFNHEVVYDIDNEVVSEGICYISVMEDDLVILIKKIISQNLKIADQVGVISYNETPMKEIILNGITTISTDFRQMGLTVARMIQEGEKSHIENPFFLTLRNSI